MNTTFPQPPVATTAPVASTTTQRASPPSTPRVAAPVAPSPKQCAAVSTSSGLTSVPVQLGRVVGSVPADTETLPSTSCTTAVARRSFALATFSAAVASAGPQVDIGIAQSATSVTMAAKARRRMPRRAASLVPLLPLRDLPDSLKAGVGNGAVTA